MLTERIEDQIKKLRELVGAIPEKQWELVSSVCQGLKAEAETAENLEKALTVEAIRNLQTDAGNKQAVEQEGVNRPTMRNAIGQDTSGQT